MGSVNGKPNASWFQPPVDQVQIESFEDAVLNPPLKLDGESSTKNFAFQTESLSVTSNSAATTVTEATKTVISNDLIKQYQAHTNTILNWSGHFLSGDCPVPISLEENLNSRKTRLENARKDFQIHNMLKDNVPRDLPSYVEKASKVDILLSHVTPIGESAISSVIDTLRAEAFGPGSFLATILNHKFKTTEDYKKLIYNIPPKFEIPDIWTKDSYFATQHYLGPNAICLNTINDGKLPPALDNPESIKLIDDYIKSNWTVNGTTLDSLLKKKGGLSYKEFSIFNDIPKKTREERFVCAPTVLFANENVDGNRINFDPSTSTVVHPKPLAIVLNFYEGSQNPTFIPTDPNWFLAKIYTNCADANFHESVSHLLNTHLMCEAFDLITHRELDITHPVFQILDLHFFFTTVINAAARSTLLSSTGAFASIFSIGNPGVFEVMESYWKNNSFDTYSFEKDSTRRGYNMKDLPPSSENPYRAYAGDHWNKIKTFVSDFLFQFYGAKNAKVLETDKELQSWFKALKIDGNVKITQDKLTLDLLVEIVSSVIFNATIVHSAVNFCQAEFYTFVPSYSGILRKAPPSTRDSPPAESKIKDWEVDPLHNDDKPNALQNKWLMQILPNRHQALQQISIVHVLSTPTEIAFGDYYEHHYSMLAKPLQKVTNDFLCKFNDVPWRFQAIRIGYPWLLPSNICESVSI